MPNRIIRDWTDSEKVNALSCGAEVLFTRLFMKADDYGSFHANIKLIKGLLFPLRETKDEDILCWLKELIDLELIIIYSVKQKNYLRILNFGQRMRNMKNRFPEPEIIDNSPQLAATSSNSPPETETRNKKLETEVEKIVVDDGRSFIRVTDLSDMIFKDDTCKKRFMSKFIDINEATDEKFNLAISNFIKNLENKDIKEGYWKDFKPHFNNWVNKIDLRVAIHSGIPTSKESLVVYSRKKAIDD